MIIKRPAVIKAVYAFANEPRMTVEMVIGKKTAPVRSGEPDRPVITLGIASRAAAYDMGKRLADTLHGLLHERNAADEWHNDMVAKAAQSYGSSVIDATAPDCTFDVRAGSLLPMNRLPNADDKTTLTFSTDYVEVELGVAA